jgi:pimeloyl-ACP methyl ester carboxylesterase
VKVSNAFKSSLSIRVAILGLMTLAVVTPAHEASCQQTCVRIMKQDSTLNNLVDPPGYQTAPLGTLGSIIRKGTGTQPMLLIPGLGFGGDVFTEFMDEHSSQYRMIAVTLPGFGGTPAPPCPRESTSFGDQTWTNGALAGLEKLIEDEHLANTILVGHWLTGTQLAVRLAAKHPDKIKAVILLAGSPRWHITDTAYAKFYSTPERRVGTVDNYLSKRWFKTVTRATWDDNNFLPQDYAVNPVRALRLWREAATPLLHVWIRYLCEFNAQDLCPDLQKLSTPTLVLRPGLEGLWVEGQNYMEDTYCHNSWNGCVEGNPAIRMVTIPDSRACLWFDQPERMNAAMQEFLQTVK